MTDFVSDRGERPGNAAGDLLDLPARYELVVGDTFELFYKGILKTPLSENYYVEITSKTDCGSAYAKRFVWTPSGADRDTAHTITVTAYGPDGSLADRKTVELVVKDAVASPASEKVVLYVGDSLASNGAVPDEFFRRLTGSGGSPAGKGLSNIAFIGTRRSGRNSVPFEGYGGWTFQSYNTENSLPQFQYVSCPGHGKTAADQHSVYRDGNGTEWKLETVEEDRIKIVCTGAWAPLPRQGALAWVTGGADRSDLVYGSAEQAPGNPFWDPAENRVDFAKYVSAQGYGSLDYVYVLLGWNSWWTSESPYREQVGTFIRNVRASFPSCQIVLLGLEVPARDGLAANYGLSLDLASYRYAQNHVFNLNRWYEEIAETHENVSFVQISGQFDTEHCMQTGTRTVNERSGETETFQINGVHPALSGYYQIADACYRDFIHKLNE